MLSIATQVTKNSTTCEGVSFTIRKLSKIQKAQRDLSIFEHRLRGESLTAQYWDLAKERDQLKSLHGYVPPEDPSKAAAVWLSILQGLSASDVVALKSIDAQILAVDGEFELVYGSYLVPSAIRAGLVSITGLEIDGQPATPELLATSATPELDDLIREIYAECEAASGLQAAQKKNSQSPTTSPAPVVSEETNSTAGTASA